MASGITEPRRNHHERAGVAASDDDSPRVSAYFFFVNCSRAALALLPSASETVCRISVSEGSAKPGMPFMLPIADIALADIPTAIELMAIARGSNMPLPIEPTEPKP